MEVGRHSDRAVLRVLDAVDGWLDDAGAGFADMRLGKRSYRFTDRPAPELAASEQGSAPVRRRGRVRCSRGRTEASSPMGKEPR